MKTNFQEITVGLCCLVKEIDDSKSELESKVSRLLEYIRFVEGKLADVAELVGYSEGELLADIKGSAGYIRPRYLIDGD